IVEDSEDDMVALLRELRYGDYSPVYQRVDTPQDMEAALAQESWDIIVSDYNMPHFSAPAALRLSQQSNRDLPFIIVSGVIGEDEAVAAMKSGAHDYIMKGNLARLVPAIQREIREAEQRRERRQLEEQLRQSQKMESIGRLAGGVAHDFNNLLTAIMGHAQMAAFKLPDGHLLKDHLQEIQRSAESASNLTRQLLAFSRRQVIEPKVVNLNHLIVDLGRMLHRLIGEDIELVIRPETDLGLAKVDPGQFEQVLLNLVVNARDALSLGGFIEVETSNVTLDEAFARQNPHVVPGLYVLLSVSDNGMGMSEETKAHIFEPFFTTKEEGKGTGLGLATCYGIVRQSSGHIEVHTQLGRGTTFNIYLPQSFEAAPGYASPRDERLLQGQETVLLVEDEGSVRTMVATMLRDRGYKVLETANGYDALRMAQDHASEEIHLLLTDIVMPQMGGVELASRFSSVRPDTKVLFTSGYPEEPIIQQGLPGETVAFIQKPFVPSVLSQKVREVLDR
ncbi:MAG: response regulator, partial [Dehalococcoidia bacterium]